MVTVNLDLPVARIDKINEVFGRRRRKILWQAKETQVKVERVFKTLLMRRDKLSVVCSHDKDCPTGNRWEKRITWKEINAKLLSMVPQRPPDLRLDPFTPECLI